jgi:hypothetical protein
MNAGTERVERLRVGASRLARFKLMISSAIALVQ